MSIDTTLICDRCGRTNATVKTRIDPYAEELYDERNEVQWCEDCFNDACDDI